jgi:hypothetical protein
MPKTIRSASTAKPVSVKYSPCARSVADGEFTSEFMKVVSSVIGLAASVMMN